MRFLKKWINFIRDVANDKDIPERDKKVILALAALIVSPVDLIPDWIPILGQLDDLMMLALILDYFFEVLDQDILLRHYPWGMKSFVRTKQLSAFITFFTPKFVKERIWKYQPSVYKR